MRGGGGGDHRRRLRLCPKQTVVLLRDKHTRLRHRSSVNCITQQPLLHQTTDKTFTLKMEQKAVGRGCCCGQTRNPSPVL